MRPNNQNIIPVVDVFAGPGGLGEGFSAFTDDRQRKHFKIALSIEKDPIAYQTLKLRSFFRQFERENVPDEYYQHLRGTLTLDELYRRYQKESASSSQETWRATLGDNAEAPLDLLREKVHHSIKGSDCWVLIGGPPCQAYSLIGRSRNKGKSDYKLEADPKARLYQEYLQLIADFWPGVFVMENVKGLLSSRINGDFIFDTILGDLEQPAEAIQRANRQRLRKRGHTYRILSLGVDLSNQRWGAVPKDYVIMSEKYGIPQARHRVLLIGVRDDIAKPLPTLKHKEPISLKQVIDDLPIVRSRLSKEEDSAERWADAVLELSHRSSLFEKKDSLILDFLRTLRSKQQKMAMLDYGSEFMEGRPDPSALKSWFIDNRLRGFCNHTVRGHIRLDLQRYVFAIAYSVIHGRTPDLHDFPAALLPNHVNAVLNGKNMDFADRFRVQLPHCCATTVTSHISKDGHYFIHYDPMQCRSLTVREAARIQTFPDSYFFEGPRTSQYQQVGNAVPPLLAKNIAEAVYSLVN